MGKKNRFVDRDIFENIMTGVLKKDGSPYDARAIDEMHGDLSRFVVGILAKYDPSELRQFYTDAGWSNNMWADALHRAANEWIVKNP